MGGSGTINDMIYVRGNRADYDEWESLGNVGWGYEDVLPYFIKAENMTEPTLANSRFHGTEGPLNVQYSRYTTPMIDEYIKAGVELGWRVGDYNGIDQTVVAYNQWTINGAVRESAANAYLKPIVGRKNLDVILQSVVSRVIIEDKVAKGVEYHRDGSTYRVFAKCDVILSAGAIDTPKLLMLSGIGPISELNRHNISVIMDLPVGAHYVDHAQLVLFFGLSDDAPTVTPQTWKTNESIVEYARDRRGPLTMGGLGCEVVSFFNPMQEGGLPLVEHNYCSSGSTLSDNEDHIIVVGVSNTHLTSEGTVTLRSADYRDPPLIDPNLFEEEIDRIALEKGVEVVNKFLETSAMSKYSPQVYYDLLPACRGMSGKEFIECVVPQYTRPGFHPSGTAKMGPSDCQDAVISSEDLFVRGLKKLRVVDASVMPTIPRGNINAQVIMVAEKAADIIKCTSESNAHGTNKPPTNSNKPPKKPNMFEYFVNTFQHVFKPPK